MESDISVTCMTTRVEDHTGVKDLTRFSGDLHRGWDTLGVVLVVFLTTMSEDDLIHKYMSKIIIYGLVSIVTRL